jgi:hypothetical protein
VAVAAHRSDDLSGRLGLRWVAQHYTNREWQSSFDRYMIHYIARGEDDYTGRRGDRITFLFLLRPMSPLLAYSGHS